jgi:hypothetical protein
MFNVGQKIVFIYSGRHVVNILNIVWRIGKGHIDNVIG